MYLRIKLFVQRVKHLAVKAHILSSLPTFAKVDLWSSTELFFEGLFSYDSLSLFSSSSLSSLSSVIKNVVELG